MDNLAIIQNLRKTQRKSNQTVWQFQFCENAVHFEKNRRISNEIQRSYTNRVNETINVRIAKKIVTRNVCVRWAVRVLCV